MSTVAQTGGAAKPAEGGHCPVCNNGLLFKIAENADGIYLACFNCDTRGTVSNADEWVASVDPTQQTPVGFQVTHDQLEAKRALDIEQAVARRRAADAAPATAPAPPAEPHETHDVAPPPDQPPPPPGEGGQGA